MILLASICLLGMRASVLGQFETGYHLLLSKFGAKRGESHLDGARERHLLPGGKKEEGCRGVGENCQSSCFTGGGSEE